MQEYGKHQRVLCKNENYTIYTKMCVEIVNFYEDGPKFNAPTHIAYGHLDKPVGPQCLQWVCNKLQFLKKHWPYATTAQCGYNKAYFLQIT